MKLLHFADAHIDMANYGRHDPQTGLPLRVLDFLKSLDTIVETAISERVDLVIFAGDAYKDRTPAPTFQREWGKRIVRLSQAKIPTILLVGNHDVSPSIGRAHAIQEFDTLAVPFVHVIASPRLLTAEQLGLPVQVIGLPWVSRSGVMAALDVDADKACIEIESTLTELVQRYIQQADPSLPLILTAHASVQGASYGAERMVMLGADVVLPGSLVKDPRFDYVALGHIHKAQNLNEDGHPPVIYPGSIERVDFGEAHDDKFFIVAEVQKGKTDVQWRKLEGVRPFIEAWARLESPENITAQLKAALPGPKKLKDAIVKLTVDYPRDYEKLIDEAELRRYTAECFEFHLIKRPQIEARIRLPQNETIATLTPLELLDLYWKSNHLDSAEAEALNALAKEIVEADTGEQGSRETGNAEHE
ncbi:MAG: exonuclease SbcCD subunit D [Anaerolineales bacterium]|nr:exonuclease SbcCD subunit D [Anaerolineales bacterium]MDW8276643.1 exonuclease SbcCD subunit D [Anaerolineales bacterium]